MFPADSSIAIEVAELLATVITDAEHNSKSLEVRIAARRLAEIFDRASLGLPLDT